MATIEDKIRQSVITTGESVATDPGVVARKDQLVANGEDLRESCVSVVASRITSAMAGLGSSVRAGLLPFEPSEGLDAAGDRVSSRYPEGKNVLTFTPDDACWAVIEVCAGWSGEESGEAFDTISELVVERILPIELEAIQSNLISTFGSKAPTPAEAAPGGGCLIAMTTYASSLALVAVSAAWFLRRTRKGVH